MELEKRKLDKYFMSTENEFAHIFHKADSYQQQKLFLDILPELWVWNGNYATLLEHWPNNLYPITKAGNCAIRYKIIK